MPATPGEMSRTTMTTILALDLDETLVRSDQTISARTLSGLQSWDARGHRIIIATGRPPRRTRTIPPILHAFPWICYNGGVILDRDRTLHTSTIPAEDASALVDAYINAAPHAWVGLEIADRAYTTLRVPEYDAEYTPDIRTVAHQPAAKIYFQLDEFRTVSERLGPLPTSMRLLISDKYNVAQIMPTGVSKAAGLALLVERWGLTMHDVMAFGDDTNDIEMVQQAGMGVAMGNAVPELKAIAKRVTLTNDEDGVAVVLEEYLDR